MEMEKDFVSSRRTNIIEPRLRKCLGSATLLSRLSAALRVLFLIWNR